MERLRRARAAASELFDRVALHSPARLAIGAFGLVVAAVTALLELPVSTASGVRAPFVDALFTATSAVCVTGLTTVNTGTYWSVTGQAIIIVAIAVGGLGIMTIASVLGLAVSRRLGLTQRILAAGESRASGLGEVRSMLRTIVVISAIVEVGIAGVLFPRLLHHGFSIKHAAWHSIFYGISSFNNAGFVPTESGLAPFANDVWVRAPIALGVFIGALGFPVYLNLVRHWRRPREWSLHTKLTILMVLVLTGISTIAVGILEWNNPRTLGQHSVGTRLSEVFFIGINQRSGGFAAVQHSGMHEHTWLVEDVLMFIGGGSGGTAGGIRVTTFAVLVLALVAEVRGRRDVEVFGKRIGTAVVRVALSVTLISLFIVLLGAGIVTAQTGMRLDQVLFEVVSAYATCGLSTGITPYLPASAKVTITILMFVGRLGSVTLAAALALNRQRRVIRYPSERPIIG
jgi:Trk-type K+ transport system membrane component